MKTVIGLFWGDENAQNSVCELKEAGLTEDSISVLTGYDAVRELMGAHKSHVAARYAFWGALLGIATLAPFGLGMSICECSLLHLKTWSCVGILTGSVAISLGLGALMGHLVGVYESGRSYHLYCREVCRGAKVVVVQASDEMVAKATSTLRQGRAVGVKALYLE
jgi:hypothetical protein